MQALAARLHIWFCGNWKGTFRHTSLGSHIRDVGKVATRQLIYLKDDVICEQIEEIQVINKHCHLYSEHNDWCYYTVIHACSKFLAEVIASGNTAQPQVGFATHFCNADFPFLKVETAFRFSFRRGQK